MFFFFVATLLTSLWAHFIGRCTVIEVKPTKWLSLVQLQVAHLWIHRVYTVWLRKCILLGYFLSLSLSVSYCWTKVDKATDFVLLWFLWYEGAQSVSVLSEGTNFVRLSEPFLVHNSINIFENSILWKTYYFLYIYDEILCKICLYLCLFFSLFEWKFSSQNTSVSCSFRFKLFMKSRYGSAQVSAYSFCARLVFFFAEVWQVASISLLIFYKMFYSGAFYSGITDICIDTHINRPRQTLHAIISQHSFWQKGKFNGNTNVMYVKL